MMVYFVGAGPGAIDLITVRGMELLKTADLVIYAGSLVNPELMTYCPSHTVTMNSASMTLEAVIESIMNFPPDATIVRLHTGDPSLYGAIREQMDRLDELGIAYTVVPGVSSFCGAAASVKAEYTLPGVSQTVIISRMAGRTHVPESENIRSLAAHRATMVLFLSTGMLAFVCSELIAGGYPPETHAAIVYKATWPEEEIIRGSLQTLPELATHIHQTALILAGDFLGDSYERSKLYDPAFSHAFREATK